MNLICPKCNSELSTEWCEDGLLFVTWCPGECNYSRHEPLDGEPIVFYIQSDGTVIYEDEKNEAEGPFI